MYADIQIVTEGYYDIINAIDFYSYNSKLLVLNVTLDSPYTKFKCQINDTLKEISFKVKGKLNRMLMLLECLAVLQFTNSLMDKLKIMINGNG
jgi:hypothetical protein